MDKALREIREEIEERTLSRFAAKAASSRGRRRPEEQCPIRTVFQRDRDRILYSKSFRRLMHKTQVFIAPEGDHYRTRLTHTLEVSQIARTISRALNLNEDLTEAISLGHDLGHAPFGHAGERALNKLMKDYGGFHHARQSLRVVDFLEKDGGLNLTEEVRNGIIAHTKGEKDINSGGLFSEPMTLEAEVVRISDRLAYINHDIDDAVRAGIIRHEDIPGDIRKLFGDGISQRVHTMIMDIVKCSENKPEIKMSDDISRGLDRLKNFMYERVYTNSTAKEEEPKAIILIEQLFSYFMEHPELIPPYIIERGSERTLTREVLDLSKAPSLQSYSVTSEHEDMEMRAQAVCDFIAGMTDRYAVAVHTKLFVPKGWNIEMLG